MPAFFPGRGKLVALSHNRSLATESRVGISPTGNSETQAYWRRFAR
jgi:hypothetical protein